MSTPVTLSFDGIALINCIISSMLIVTSDSKFNSSDKCQLIFEKCMHVDGPIQGRCSVVITDDAFLRCHNICASI